MRLTRRIAAAASAVLLIASLAACSPSKPELVASDQGVEPVVTVYAIDNRYEPAEVEIEAGQAVRWVFKGAMEHDVVAADGSFVSDLQITGEYVHVFEEPGEYPYDCSVHPEMTGVVTVR